MIINHDNGNFSYERVYGSLAGSRVVSYELSYKDLRDLLNAPDNYIREKLTQMWMRMRP